MAEVIDVEVVGYWEDVFFITGRGLADWLSRKIRRKLR
jgi:hypothetical protein